MKPAYLKACLQMHEYEFVDCGAPPVVDHARSKVGGLLLGSSMQYFCDDGYFSTEDIFISCYLNGVWSSPNAACEKTCGVPFQKKSMIVFLSLIS